MRKTIVTIGFSELQMYHAFAVRRNLPATEAWLERQMRAIRITPNGSK